MRARAAVLARVVDDSQLIAGYGLAAGAVADRAGPVREEDVQHLGRADPVEDLDAEMLGPAPTEVGRQRLAGGNAHARRDVSALRQLRRRQHRRVERRDAVEDRRTVLLEALEHRRR